MGLGSKGLGESKPNSGIQSLSSTGSSGVSYARSKPVGLNSYSSTLSNAKGGVDGGFWARGGDEKSKGRPASWI